MRNLIWLALALTTACAPSEDKEPPKEQSDEPTARQSIGSAAGAGTLDLSMPENFFADDQEAIEAPHNKKFDASELFNNDEDDSVTIAVTPSLETKKDQQLPKIDGATVTVEVETN